MERKRERGAKEKWARVERKRGGWRVERERGKSGERGGKSRGRKRETRFER